MRIMSLLFALFFMAGVCAAQDPAPAVVVPTSPEAAPQAAPEAAAETVTEEKSEEPSGEPVAESSPEPAVEESPAPVEAPAAPEAAPQAAPEVVAETVTEEKSAVPSGESATKSSSEPAALEAPSPAAETPQEPVPAPVFDPVVEDSAAPAVEEAPPVESVQPAAEAAVEATPEPVPVEEAPAETETEAPAAEVAPEPDLDLYLGHPLGLVVSVHDAARVADALLVDVREPEQYEQGHIAGAVNLPVKSLSEERGGVRNLLRPVDQLVTALAARGITPDSAVIVYTKITDAAEMNNAARLFWVLEYLSFPRVHLLDGGLDKWQAEGLSVETGPGKAKAVPVEAVKVTIRPEIIAKRSDVLDLVGGGTGLLVDARPGGYFTGADKADFVARPGRIPTAVSRPSADLLQGEMFEFKTEEEIRETVKVADGDMSRKVIVYCNSGNNGSLGYFGFRLAGYENVSLYDGSMAEWSLNPALAVETGDPDAEAAPATEPVPEPVVESAPVPEPVANAASETAPQP